MKFPYNKVLEIRKSFQRGTISLDEAKDQLASAVLYMENGNDFCEDAVKALADSGNGEYWQKHFQSHGPLLRLSDVCNILRLWARVYAVPVEGEDEYRKKEREKFHEAASYVDLQVSKSCLLDRLFFQDEGLRTTPCPEHKGHWSGCAWDSPGCACRNGSNVTGWLPAEEFTGYSEDPSAPLCDFCGKPPLKQGLWSGRVDGKNGHPECMDANPLPKGWKPKSE